MKQREVIKDNRPSKAAIIKPDYENAYDYSKEGRAVIICEAKRN